VPTTIELNIGGAQLNLTIAITMPASTNTTIAA
jgi:hypothetical protein